MDLTITKENIFLAKCVVYDRREGDFLVRRPLDTNDEYRVILFFCGKVIDFETAEELEVLPYDNIKEEITGPIEMNKYYVDQVYEYKQLTNEELEYVPTLLEKYQANKLREQEIKKNKKLIKFPKLWLN